jgi:hypothetical protein
MEVLKYLNIEINKYKSDISMQRAPIRNKSNNASIQAQHPSKTPTSILEYNRYLQGENSTSSKF